MKYQELLEKKNKLLLEELSYYKEEYSTMKTELEKYTNPNSEENQKTIENPRTETVQVENKQGDIEI